MTTDRVLIDYAALQEGLRELIATSSFDDSPTEREIEEAYDENDDEDNPEGGVHLETKVDRVRTVAGSRRYNLPIGAPILPAHRRALRKTKDPVVRRVLHRPDATVESEEERTAVGAALRRRGLTPEVEAESPRRVNSATLPPDQRGGDGPLPGGYSVGQRVMVTDTMGEVTVGEVVGDGWQSKMGKNVIATGRQDQAWTSIYGRALTVRRLKSSYAGHEAGATVEELVKLENVTPADVDVQEQVVRQEPSLQGFHRQEPRLRDLLSPEVYAATKKVIAKTKVSLDSKKDIEREVVTPDKLQLAQAKTLALRALGQRFGFTDEQTQDAVYRLDSLLSSWATIGGMGTQREAAHEAVEHLRSGGVADTAERRAMLLQKAWSDVTWRQKYGDRDTVKLHRFVQGDYAGRLAAVNSATTQATSVASPEGRWSQTTLPPVDMGDPPAWKVDAWTLSSWTVTPGGVQRGWIGYKTFAVQLSQEFPRDETWLNVWSEARFRTRGLKAPGEFIVDDRRELSPANGLELELHNPPKYQDYGNQGPAQMQRLDYYLRTHPGRSVDAASAAMAVITRGPSTAKLLGAPEAVDFDNSLPQLPRWARPSKLDAEGFSRRDYDEPEQYIGYEAEWEKFDRIVQRLQEQGVQATHIDEVAQGVQGIQRSGYDIRVLEAGYVEYYFQNPTPERIADSVALNEEAQRDAAVRVQKALAKIGIERTVEQILADVPIKPFDSQQGFVKKASAVLAEEARKRETVS